MECQNTVKNLKINKKKNIGEVILVVEGESEEYSLFKHIFTEILNYNYISLKRNKIIQDVYYSKTSNSSVIIVNTKNSNINSIVEDNDYKDKLYHLIQNEYHRSLKNIPIYFIWDRDNHSNSSEIIKKLLENYYSALNNDIEMNGLLLLSYPCVEAYEISNFDKVFWKSKFNSSEELKTYKKKDKKRYSLSNLNEKTLLIAVENMHKRLLQYGIINYDSDNFKKENLKIFDLQEKLYDFEKKYYALSLISLLLIDLGIIITN